MTVRIELVELGRGPVAARASRLPGIAPIIAPQDGLVGPEPLAEVIQESRGGSALRKLMVEREDQVECPLTSAGREDLGGDSQDGRLPSVD
jgi:hypothetical protein